MKWYYISTNRWTVAVDVIDGRILKSPPITRRFVGQPIGNLIGWAHKFGYVTVGCFPDDKEGRDG